MSIKAKKECVSVIHGRIEQEEVIKFEVDFCEVNYYEYEHKQEVDYIEPITCLIDSEHIVCELIEYKKVEFCEIIELIEDREIEKVIFCQAIEYQEAELIEDQKVELIEKVVFCEEIDYKNVEFCEIIELIEEKKVEFCEVIGYQKAELIEDQKVVFCEIIEDREDECCEDINMLKSSGNEPDGMKELNLSKKELRIIPRGRGAKNYENLSKSRLIKKINKSKPSIGSKKDIIRKEKRHVEFKPRKKIVSSLLLKGKRNIELKPRKKAKRMFTS